jgi:pumilio RNA-binding family
MLTKEQGEDLMTQLAEDDTRCAAIAAIRGSVDSLAFEAVGCRVVQMALQVGTDSDKAAIVAELGGHVRTGMRSPHANFVIQVVVQSMPPHLAEFVAEELTGIGGEVARHRYGCRIMCRLLKHPNAKSAALTEEILADARHLCHHAFGHHVIDSVIEHGTMDQRRRVAAVLRAHLLQSSRNRYASYVVERAMKLCSPQDQHAFVAQLLEKSEHLLTLGAHEYGSHVLRTILQLPCDNVDEVRGLIRSGADRLQASKYGRRLMDEFRKASSGPDEDRSSTAATSPK